MTKTIDMSPDAIARRLEEVRELNRVTAYLGEFGRASNRRWLVAATVLDLDPERLVRCPMCRQAHLELTTHDLGADHIERHMRCPSCGAHESLYNQKP